MPALTAHGEIIEGAWILASVLVALSLRICALRLHGTVASATTSGFVMRATGLGALVGVAVLALVAVPSYLPEINTAQAGWDLLIRPETIALGSYVILICSLEFEVDRIWVLTSSALAAGLTFGGLHWLEGMQLPTAFGPPMVPIATAALTTLLFRPSQTARVVSLVRRTAIEEAGDHVILADPDERIMYVSDHGRLALGLGPQNPSGLGPREVLPNALQQLLRDNQRKKARLRTPAGHILEARVVDLSQQRRLRGARAILVRDVTGEHQDERRLVRLAHYDSLTGLANRRLFLETLKKTLETANSENTKGALFYLDLDHFKAINDSLGHAAGDDLLRSLSDRLRSALRPEEIARLGIPTDARLMVARLAGDEFAVIAPSIPSREVGGKLARLMIDVIRQPLELTDRTMNPSASIGAALFPEDADQVEQLLHRADSALYVAKSRGRRRHAWYEGSFDEKVDRARLLEEGLRFALGRDEMRLLYQPKLDTHTGELVGFEALLRWRSNQLGNVGPSEFIPVAEERGLVTELGSWCIDEACRRMRAWTDAGLTIVPVSVNVSSAQLTESDLQRVVSGALKRYEIDPTNLELELTESMLLDEHTHVEQVLRDLRSIGVRIALDDFGTGYSALSYLNRFNLDVLKMDRSLLRDIDSNPSAHGIASAVVAMAHSLGLSVVAEGVDSEEQIPLLREMDCDQVQGFIFAPALPTEEVVRFMVQRDEGPLVFGPGMTTPDTKKPQAPARLEASVQHGEAPGSQTTAPAPSGITLEKRALLIDDGEQSLGPIALRLGHLGVDVHYASDINEAQLFVYEESDTIRLIVCPPAVPLDKIRSLREQLAGVNEDPPRFVIIGEQPPEKERRRMRDLGVDWVLWAPFNDTELRYVVRSAMTQRDELAHRREVRMPVDLMANIWCGDRRELAVVSSLSPRGAFVELSDPLEEGSSLRIEMDIAGNLYRGFGRVVYVHTEANRPHDEPSGIGVTFYGAGRDEERILRKAISELEFRFRP